VADLVVDETYQRPLDPGKVYRIATNFDPDAFGVIVINRRDTGETAIIDGGHRVAALYDMGWDDQKVQAVIHQGLTVAEEARIYAILNKERTKPKATDIFRADVTAGFPDALEVQSVLDKHGLKVVNSPKARGIRSIGTCRRLHKIGGTELLDKVLTSMIKAFGDDDPTNFYHDLMLAVGGVFFHRPEASISRVVQGLKMAGGDVQIIVSRGRGTASVSDTRANTEMANLILRQYNKNLRVNRQELLDPNKNLFVNEM
jgi:hypothetical protein